LHHIHIEIGKMLDLQHQYNNCTTIPHVRMGPTYWGPPSCEGLYSYCIGIVQESNPMKLLVCPSCGQHVSRQSSYSAGVLGVFFFFFNYFFTVNAVNCRSINTFPHSTHEQLWRTQQHSTNSFPILAHVIIHRIDFGIIIALPRQHHIPRSRRPSTHIIGTTMQDFTISLDVPDQNPCLFFVFFF